ncbi:MAG: DASS family sodium-coupled anion symporter [Rhodopila sp.]|nr:DASS family sodium-coupled anion symporter [Rhodopila sp.]
MSTTGVAVFKPQSSQATAPPHQWWRAAVPVAIAVALALLPPPPGLAQHAWYYFALFAGVIAGLVTEPIPNPAVGLVGLTLAAVLSRWVLFSPSDLAKPGFNVVSQSVNWALSGFASTTVWLVGGAFMFALGYEKTGLGRRIALLLVRALGKRTLTLGYATTFADAILAPFTPSNTARGAGIIFPVMNNLPALYDSRPHDPSARKIGGYIMWTTFAADCVTSTLFMTACAPNFLARDFIGRIAHVTISYGDWMRASLPFALPLLLALPLLTYWIFPPEIKRSPEVSNWARTELETMGGITWRETVLGVLVLCAIMLWILGGSFIDPTLAAFLVLSLMLVLGVVTWGDMARNHSAWTTIVLLATLVTLADGLSRAGFVKWFADYTATHVGGLPPMLILMSLVAIYFLSHYMFASLTAHTTAMMPMMLAAGLAIPGLSATTLAMGLAMTTGIMGVLTPYATGAALPYYNCGYLTPAQFWRLGAIFGLIFIAALLGIGVPLLAG